MAGSAPIRSLALVGNYAHSLSNFRGPLIAALVERGIRLWALAPDYTPVTRDRIVRLGAEPVDISLERAGMLPHRDMRDTMRLVRQFRRLRPDAVLCYTMKPVVYGVLAAKLAGVPLRYSLVPGLGYVHTDSAGAGTVRRRALRSLSTFLYRRAFALSKAVFLYNDADRDHFQALGILPAAKTRMLQGTGIELAQFNRLPPPVPRPMHFLLVARLLREKGVAEFVDAARVLKRAYPDAVFDLVGGVDSNPGSFTEAEVCEWDRQGVVRWHGQVDDVRPFLAISSVFVLPSYREGKPRSTQEAMAAGRAIVTTDAPGCRDTVEEGVNGFKVPVANADALTAALRRFLTNPDLCIAMGRESARLAEERFDVARINAQILATLGVA